ncbi:hypothetical protein GCM10009691_37100 [Brevibacterium picturae]|uniref:Uncharacterized protein n=1 Tax=Brevibacterium picturae TaxID=260553 RepID=A0ABN2CJE2_9MICO
MIIVEPTEEVLSNAPVGNAREEAGPGAGQCGVQDRTERATTVQGRWYQVRCEEVRGATRKGGAQG